MRTYCIAQGNIYINHFAVHLDLTQHCKAAILQFLKMNFDVTKEKKFLDIGSDHIFN